MPHIDSKIEAQRIMCIQNFLDNSPRSRTFIINHYLNKVEGGLLFCCNLLNNKMNSCVCCQMTLSRKCPNVLLPLSCYFIIFSPYTYLLFTLSIIFTYFRFYQNL